MDECLFFSFCESSFKWSDGFCAFLCSEKAVDSSISLDISCEGRLCIQSGVSFYRSGTIKPARCKRVGDRFYGSGPVEAICEISGVWSLRNGYCAPDHPDHRCGQWSPWSECECETRKRSRTRHGTCNANHETEDCVCDVDCAWSHWTDGHCSATCGVGTSIRTRHIRTERMGNGHCCHGSSTEVVHCDTRKPCLDVLANRLCSTRNGFFPVGCTEMYFSCTGGHAMPLFCVHTGDTFDTKSQSCRSKHHVRRCKGHHKI